MKARDGLLVLKLEAQALRVVAQNLNVGQLQVDPSLVAADKDLGALGGGAPRAVAVQTDTGTGQTDGDVDGRQRGLALGGLGGLRGLRGSLCGVLAEGLCPVSPTNPSTKGKEK